MSSDSPEIDKAYKRLLKALQRAQGLAQDSAVSEQAVETAPPSATEAVSTAPPAIPPQATPPQQPVVVPQAEDKTEHFTGSSIRKEPKRGDEKAGDIIDGRYELERMLKEGGQGAVWRAKDLKTHRAIAIKLIFPNHKHAERALREPKLLRDLNHENIVEIRDIEILKEQVSPYIAYEYIEGHDLNHVVHNSMPSIEQAATWCRDIARAMQHAHEQGVLHRDLKPENVMVQTSTNKIKVIDFGLGKAVPSLKNDEKSKSGDVSLVGTGRWFAPEQVFFSKATFATDIYQIGAILYFTLTREAPRDRQAEVQPDSPPNINSIRREIGLPEVPTTLENICRQALKTRASERQATAQELADQLESFLGIKPSSNTFRIPRRRAIYVVATLGFIGILTASSSALTTKKYEANWISLPLQGEPTLFYPEKLQVQGDLFIPRRMPFWGLTSRETELRVHHLGLIEFGAQQVLNDQPLYDLELKADIKINNSAGGYVGFYTGRHPDADNPDRLCMDTTLICYPQSFLPYVQHGKVKIRDPQKTNTNSESEEFGDTQSRSPLTIDRQNWHTLHLIYKSGILYDVLIDGTSMPMSENDKALLANDVPYPLNRDMGIFVYQSDVTVKNVQIKVPLMNYK